MQPAVEIVVVPVADHVEQPDEASGPAAAFVVVHHVHRIGAMAQRAEHPFQLRLFGQQARCGRSAQLGLFGIDEAGARQVAFGIAGSTGQIDQISSGASRRVARSAGSITSGRLEKADTAGLD